MIESDERTLSTDRLLHLLADRKRREVLRYLADRQDTPVHVEELAAGVAGAGSDVGALAATLHHNHLPKLSAAGVVDYDTRTRTVRYRSRDAVEDILAYVGENLE